MNELFPIGTIVLLKNGTKKVMITGFYATSENDSNQVYDYLGCLYPEGILSSDENLVFNHNDVATIVFRGYDSEEEKNFKQKLDFAVKSLNIKN